MSLVDELMKADARKVSERATGVFKSKQLLERTIMPLCVRLYDAVISTLLMNRNRCLILSLLTVESGKCTLFEKQLKTNWD